MCSLYNLLLMVAILLTTISSGVSAATVLGQSNSVEALQTTGVIFKYNSEKRFLRSPSTDEEDKRVASDGEERVGQGLKKIFTRLKNWTDKDLRRVKLFEKGASFEKLYEKKVDPYVLFTKMRFGYMTEAEKAGNALYLRWGEYLKYWADMNKKRAAGLV